MSVVASLPRRGGNPPAEGASPAPNLRLAGHQKATPDELVEGERIWSEFRSDPRYPEFAKGCLNCGECTTGCPAARYYDYSPREMMQVALEGDPPTVLDAMREKIWACCQCYSCTMRCRFGNDIAGTVSILRELAVRHGLESAQKVVAPFGRTLTLLMTVGTQISPDMIQPEFFPDWGPRAGGSPQDWNISSDVLRQAVPIDVLQTNRAAWEVSVETSLELFRIYEEAGVVEMVRAVDPDLTEMLIDIIETRREELAEARARYTERSHHDPPPEAPHAER